MDLACALSLCGRPRVLVVGDVILDRYTWGDAGRVSPEAPVLVLNADTDEVRLGGAASVACLLAHLDVEVSLAGIVGDDPEGRTVLRLLQEEQIDTRLMETVPGRLTTVKERFLGRVAGRHPHQILRVDREESAAFSGVPHSEWGASILEQMSGFQTVLISDYGKGACPGWLVRVLIDAARDQQIPILIDPARIPRYQRYRGASLLKPNRTEAALVAHKTIVTPQDALQAGQKLCRQLEIPQILITLDADGMVLAGERGPGEHFPIRSREVYDVTGAGDMALAMLGVCQAAGLPWHETVQLANLAAGLEVEKIGVTPVTRGDLLNELQGICRTSGAKLISIDQLLNLVTSYRQSGQRIALLSGHFDRLQAGMVRDLEDAARRADRLIVAVAADDSFRRTKSGQIVTASQRDRATAVAAIGAVDHVVLYDDATPEELVRQLRPDVWIADADPQADSHKKIGRASVS